MKYKILILVSLLFVLTACGNEQISEQKDDISIAKFEKDNNTIQEKDEFSILELLNQNQQQAEEESKEHDNPSYVNHIGELTIVDNEQEISEGNTENEAESNQDNEQNESKESESNEQVDTGTDATEANIQETEISNISYQISDFDIVYNGITYMNLYKNIQEIEAHSQYNADTLIKFVLYCYKSEEQVYTAVKMDKDANNIDTNEDSEEESDNNDRTIDEILSNESDDYNSLCINYNSKATWMVEMYNAGYKNVAKIAGCESFTIIIGTNESVEVDVSNFGKQFSLSEE